MVYEILKDGKSYARWWKPAYVASEQISPDRIRSVVRSKFPYTLIFTTELVRDYPPSEIGIKSLGDLVGTGLWRLRQEGEWTFVIFDWNVRAEKKVIRWLSPFLKPFFRWNHDWVMEMGEAGLQNEVRAQEHVL